MVTISFPGLGIEPFTINPVAFTLFGTLEVRWYGLIITLGIILAFAYAAFRSKQEGIDFDSLLDIALFTIFFGIVGARAYYVLTSLDKYESFWELFAIWEGGLAIYGAIIAGAITVFAVCRYKKIKVLKMMDAAAPAVMIGQILGRWGNFCNGEAYGAEILESNPLYFLRMGLLPNIESRFQMHYFHPTFLYESVWNLVGFLIINALYKKKKFDGQVVLMYVTWYGFGRMLIEGLRTDSLYVGVFRISQVVGFLCFVIGSILLIVGFTKARRDALTSEIYNPAYGKLSGLNSEASAESTDPVEEPEAEIEENEETEEKEMSAEEREILKKRFASLFEEDESSDEDETQK